MHYNWYNGSAVGLYDGTASRYNVKGHRRTGSSINRVALYLGKFFAEFRFNGTAIYLIFKFFIARNFSLDNWIGNFRWGYLIRLIVKKGAFTSGII